jgi:hypothetical protein
MLKNLNAGHAVKLELTSEVPGAGKFEVVIPRGKNKLRKKLTEALEGRTNPADIQKGAKMLLDPLVNLIVKVEAAAGKRFEKVKLHVKDDASSEITFTGIYVDGDAIADTLLNGTSDAKDVSGLDKLGYTETGKTYKEMLKHLVSDDAGAKIKEALDEVEGSRGTISMDTEGRVSKSGRKNKEIWNDTVGKSQSSDLYEALADGYLAAVEADSVLAAGGSTDSMGVATKFLGMMKDKAGVDGLVSLSKKLSSDKAKALISGMKQVEVPAGFSGKQTGRISGYNAAMRVQLDGLYRENMSKMSRADLPEAGGPVNPFHKEIVDKIIAEKLASGDTAKVQEAVDFETGFSGKVVRDIPKGTLACFFEINQNKDIKTAMKDGLTADSPAADKFARLAEVKEHPKALEALMRDLLTDSAKKVDLLKVAVADTDADKTVLDKFMGKYSNDAGSRVELLKEMVYDNSGTAEIKADHAAAFDKVLEGLSDEDLQGVFNGCFDGTKTPPELKGGHEHLFTVLCSKKELKASDYGSYKEEVSKEGAEQDKTALQVFVKRFEAKTDEAKATALAGQIAGKGKDDVDYIKALVGLVGAGTLTHDLGSGKTPVYHVLNYAKDNPTADADKLRTMISEMFTEIGAHAMFAVAADDKENFTDVRMTKIQGDILGDEFNLKNVGNVEVEDLSAPPPPPPSP